MSEPFWTTKGHDKWVNSVAFFNDGRRVVSGSADKTLQIWDVEERESVGELKALHNILSVAISPDDRRIASGGTDNAVHIWDITHSQAVFHQLVKHIGWVNSVCFSPNGRKLASGSHDATIIIWDVDTGDVVVKLDGHCGAVLSVAFSPDGQQLSSASWMGIIQVWYTDVAHILLEIRAHQSSIRSVVWSSNGQQLASTSFDKTVRFWNSSNGNRIGEVCTNHTRWVRSLAISCDDSFIATASDDWTARLSCTKMHRQIGQALKHIGCVNCVAISPNGTLLVSGDNSGRVYFWSISYIMKRYNMQEHQKETEKQDRLILTGLVDNNDTQVEISHDTLNAVSFNHEGTTSTPSNTHVRTNNPSASDLPSLFLETMQGQCQVGDSGNQENNMDVESLDSPLPKQDEVGVFPDARSSLGLDHATTFQNSDANSIQDMPSVQPDFHSLVRPDEMLQDLTGYVTEDIGYPVAGGGFGDIWKCTYKTDTGPIKVAVKSFRVYNSEQGGETKKAKMINRELKACSRLHHENIIRVYGTTHGFGIFPAIVSHWAENGNLTNYLELKGATLTLVRRFQILRDITAGLKYLHANYAIHGDLTGSNVLIHNDGTACLTDFGLILLYSEFESITQASWFSTLQGNPYWLAPELLASPDTESGLPIRPSKYSDIYSLGGVILQALTSKIPYYYLHARAATVQIYTGNKPLRLHYSGLSDKYWDLIEECWSALPADRPSAEKVAQLIGDEIDSLSSSSGADLADA